MFLVKWIGMSAASSQVINNEIYLVRFRKMDIEAAESGYNSL